MSAKKKTVFVIYYSQYGHVLELAREICKGLEKSGVQAKLFQVKETLSEEILEKMKAPSKAADIPIIETNQLKEAHGILFGVPTRFGMLPAQMKAFFDSCGQLWSNGALVNKYVGTFFSTGSIGGGQESTSLSMIPFFAHMGMNIVFFGGKAKSILSVAKDYHGGSAYGSGTYASDLNHQNRSVSEDELKLAEEQGFDFGSLVRKQTF